MGVHVVDLRGQCEGRSGHSVLADPTGRRRRQLTRMARLLACLLGVWLCGLVLAGVGLLPGRLGPWALLVGSPPPSVRSVSLGHPWRPKAALTQASSPATGLRRTSTGSGLSDRKRGIPSGGLGSEGGRLLRARDQGGLKPGERTRIAPIRHGSSRVTATAPMRAPAGAQTGAFIQPGVTRASPTAGRAQQAGQSGAKRAQAPGHTELAPGWGIATSATQASPTPSTPQGHVSSTPEHHEAAGHEKATLTPP